MASNADDATDSGLESDQPSAKSCKMDESSSSKDEQSATSTKEETKPVQETNNQSKPVAMVTQEGDASENESAATTETVASEESQKGSAEVASSSQSEGASIAPSSDSQNSSTVPKETVNMKVMYNKKKHDVTFDLDGTVLALKAHIETITGVPQAMQKLMFKGLMKDDKTLRELNVNKGAKLMLVGSTITDVLEVTKPVPKTTAAEKAAEAAAAKEPLCKQKLHKKVLDKGKPEDAMPGIKNRQDPLPTVPVAGMYNKTGGKVRLTFKLEVDQIWIGTKERTEKVPMTSIKNVVSEPIEGHEEYHILAIQLGPTEASRYWVYWVPAQYTTAIKDAILGKWQYF